MGGKTAARPRKEDPVARAYIRGVRDERRRLYDQLEAVILGLYPEAELVVAYGVPTYQAKEGRVGLGYWKGGVSFYPFGSAYLDEFRVRFPEIRTSKGTVNFEVGRKVPRAALRQVIRRSIEQPIHGPRPTAKGNP